MDMNIPIMNQLFTQGIRPKYLYWVGCAGAYDFRYRKVAKTFTKILLHVGEDFAILGTEETCTGDMARRAGNEMLFQLQAIKVIETLRKYDVKNIICICPHCYNTFRNEYPDLGGYYNVLHYTQYLRDLIKKGRLKLDKTNFNSLKVTFHDPCYLGRANGEYEAPRYLIRQCGFKLVEMGHCKSYSICCGAGGGQLFAHSTRGTKEIYIERTKEAIQTEANVIATACPFCMIMFTDGIKILNKDEVVQNLDIIELVAMALGL